MASPGWYHHLFTAPDRVVERWLAKVAELSAGLRKSAAGFRLPGNAGDRASATGTVRRLEDTTLTTAKVRQISALGGS